MKHQMQAANNAAARLDSPTSLQTTSRDGSFACWGRRISATPNAKCSDTRMHSHPVAPSMARAAPFISCEQCEGLKAQSDINRKLLNACVTDLQIKEIEAEAVKDLVKKQRIQLGKAQSEVELEQAQFKRESALKDQQLLELTAQCRIHVGAADELAAQLVKQHKELTKDLPRVIADYERVCQAKEQEIVILQGKLETQEIAEGDMKTKLQGKITYLEDSLCHLMQGTERRASAYVAELQHQFEQRFHDDMQKHRTRTAALEADNQKLNGQLSTDDETVENDFLDWEGIRNAVAL